MPVRQPCSDRPDSEAREDDGAEQHRDSDDGVLRLDPVGSRPDRRELRREADDHALGLFPGLLYFWCHEAILACERQRNFHASMRFDSSL